MSPRWSVVARRAVLPILLGATLLPSMRPPVAAGEECDPIIAMTDTSRGNSYSSLVLGRAAGQTFFAHLTRIRAITVWRIGPEPNAFGVRLFIMNTDSLGVPDSRSIIQNGPTIAIPSGDGGPVEFRYAFEPPFQLPAPGLYEFAVQADPSWGSSTVLAQVNFDDYSEGTAWQHGRTSLDRPRPSPTQAPNADLIFTIEFCDSSGSTPVILRSWGTLKELYRRTP